MVPFRLALGLAVCAFGVAALLVLPPLHAAEGKKRVHVTYGPKASAKTPPTNLPARAGSTTLPSPSGRRPGEGVARGAQPGRDATAGSRAQFAARAPWRLSRKPATQDRLALVVAGSPNLKSASALVVDLNDGRTIYAKNTHSIAPIASITKLMTAMVLLDADLPLEETIYIDAADLDFVKHTNSRLAIGTGLSRRDMLRLALMSSENRAAAALGRSYPGGQEVFIAAMNRKAIELGMGKTRFVDSTGLSSENVSTAEDLVKMVKGAFQYPLIREFTTTSAHDVETASGRNLQFRNSNGLVKSAAWEIGLSKTGYISEAGRCLVMQTKIAARSVVIVLLDSWGKYTRTADANRIKKWLESHSGRKPVG